PLAAGLAACAVPAFLAFTYFTRQRHLLIAQNRLLTGTLDADPHGRVITAPNGRVVYGNAAFMQMYGVGSGSASQIFQASLNDGSEVGRQLSMLRSLAGSGGTGHAEVRGVSPSGETMWRSISAYPIKDHFGYVLWRIEDVTSRRQMEQVI